MTLNYTNRVEVAETGQDARELPEAVQRAVVQDLEQTSVVLQLANVQHMGTRQERINLVSSFPEGEWLRGLTAYPGGSNSGTNDTGSQRSKASQPKKTTTMAWTSKRMEAEELAVTVAIPDSYIDDSGVPLFDEIRPKLVTEFAKKIDSAILFGDDNPFVEDSIVENAIATGNIVLKNSTNSRGDLTQDIARLGEVAGDEGVEFNGFVGGPGFRWKLAGLRDDVGQPIYTPPSQGAPAAVYGVPFYGVQNGTWDNDLALLLGGEWDKVHIGLRQDVTFTITDSGTIYDPATGLVKYSAFQQDGKILRAVMRLAYVMVNPHRHLGNIYPFFVYQDNTLS